MPLFEIGDVGLRDTVLVEGQIIRWWPKTSERPRGPAPYRAFIELRAISMLLKDTSLFNEEDEIAPAREFSDNEELEL